MARTSRRVTLDAPRGRAGVLSRTPQPSRDRFGRFTEWIARKMGTPWFQMKDLARQHGIIALSSNYALYADMSNRMMSVLSQYSPDQEIYSIDECFLGLDGFENYDLVIHAQAMRSQVRQWVGIPVCVGIAETKTLS